MRLRGESDNDAAGASLGWAGDVDADGYPELLVGAPTAGAHGINTSAAYPLYGGLR